MKRHVTNQRRMEKGVMKHIATVVCPAALLLLAAPAWAQDGNDSARGYSHEGELSPGTQAPSQDALMAVIQSGLPERMFAMLEYGERVECHTCVPLVERQLLENDDSRVREIRPGGCGGAPSGSRRSSTRCGRFSRPTRIRFAGLERPRRWASSWTRTA